MDVNKQRTGSTKAQIVKYLPHNIIIFHRSKYHFQYSVDTRKWLNPNRQQYTITFKWLNVSVHCSLHFQQVIFLYREVYVIKIWFRPRWFKNKWSIVTKKIIPYRYIWIVWMLDRINCIWSIVTILQSANARIKLIAITPCLVHEIILLILK